MQVGKDAHREPAPAHIFVADAGQRESQALWIGRAGARSPHGSPAKVGDAHIYQRCFHDPRLRGGHHLAPFAQYEAARALLAATHCFVRPRLVDVGIAESIQHVVPACLVNVVDLDSETVRQRGGNRNIHGGISACSAGPERPWPPDSRGADAHPVPARRRAAAPAPSAPTPAGS